ncbi:hypothetical protein CANARDRAFT_175780 [[Candida] arabinofermentans NRRL YB-2248]|uniref:Large ribosomal subunit protein mL46 n=1 Tax=[Candida] arabinofermentans NRRL YB-2248 TaxID=983967 RepID=A0A1E4T2Y7_9ASCO|nr:hypothetical protein CANARDRAFT_175780 [[Candida] arabinofermentans NRRL YB-2248]
MLRSQLYKQAKRSFATTATTTSDAQIPLSSIHAGLILSRTPLVSPELSEFEQKFYHYQEELERRLMWTFPRWYYFKKGTVAEREFAKIQKYPIPKHRGVWFPKGVPDIKHGRDRRFKEEIVLPKRLIESDEIETTQDSTNSTELESESKSEDLDDVSRPIKPQPRFTKADELNDQTSLERKLSRTLYLLVKQNNTWKFPAFQLQDESKPLHQVVQDGVKLIGGNRINTWVVSNTPTAVLKYSQNKLIDNANESDTNITREYLMKSHIVAGKFELNQSEGCQEYKWLVKEEIEELVDDDYYKKIGSDFMTFKPNTLKNLEILLSKDFGNYHELRKEFVTTRAKYDAYLERFMSQSKTYDPSKSKEDAFQLFEMRKQYVNISLSLCILLIKIEIKVSSVLVDICDIIWNASPSTINIVEFLGISKHFKIMERSKYCISLQNNSYKSLLKDLIRARVSSEEGVTELFTPSSNINSYNSATINNGKLYMENMDDQNEKHGWVLMKSTKINSKEIIWIRRWFFIKDNLFGFLSLSPNGLYVEESDKIGVLLANFRYYPEEDRKFCFEIKTYQTTIILQAETLAELKGWLTVFKNVKLKAIEMNDEQASSRYEPMVEKFKLTPIVSKDYELINDLGGSTKDDAYDLINQTLSSLQINIDFNPPMVTQFTNLACLSQLYLSPSIVPSAVTANIWGFVNWGVYYIMDNAGKEAFKSIPTSETAIMLKYPDYYTLDLRIIDLQMRSIFAYSIPPDEYALSSFKASWTPNSQQELMCNFFLTGSHIYVYTMNCGLVSLAPISVLSFLQADAIEKDKYDILKLYLVSGVSIKLKIFYVSSLTIRDQINYLIRTKRSPIATPLKTIIDEFSKIRDVFEKGGNPSVAPPLLSNQPKQPADKSIVTVASPADSQNEMKLNYSDMNLLWAKTYDLPSKALFHVLVGDQSLLLQSLLPFSRLSDGNNLSQTVWRCDSNQRLTRIIWNIGSDLLSVKQYIDTMSNNKYYNFCQVTPNLALPFGARRKLEIRIIICSTDSRTSKLLVYYKVTRGSSIINWVTKLIFKQVMMFMMDEVDSKLLESTADLGKENRKIASAIRLFGPITKYDDDEMPTEEIRFDQHYKRVRLRTLINFILQKLNLDIDRLLHEFTKSLFIAVTTYSYWTEKHTKQYVDHMVHTPTIMKRAILMSDIENLTKVNHSLISFDSNNSPCYSEFKKRSDVLNFADNFYESNMKIKNSIIDIALKRNELLTDLNMLNKMEKSYLEMEWKNWVLSEYKTCGNAKTNYPDEFTASLEKYCESVKLELEYSYMNLI